MDVFGINFHNGTRSVFLTIEDRCIVADFHDTEGMGFSVPEMFELIRNFIGANPDPLVVTEDLAVNREESLFKPSQPGETWSQDFDFPDEVFGPAVFGEPYDEWLKNREDNK